ncbi:MAG: ribosome biogenesis GTP-binding protein YihA/YsxC [Patescibacteria group bacterium]|jgi:GTP-binding protein
MQIKSAKFVKGLVGPDKILENNIPKIVFIGRSNVGKSSLINSLTRQKGLAKTSSLPGRTQELNVFLINDNFYFVDLPGYGFAKLSKKDKKWLHELINWYLFDSYNEHQKIVLIVDAEIGPTKDDLEILKALEECKKNIIIVANKEDKIKKSLYQKQLNKIQDSIGDHKIFPFSSKTGFGADKLLREILE